MANRLEVKVSGDLLFRFHTCTEFEDSNIPEELIQFLDVVNEINARSSGNAFIQVVISGNMVNEFLDRINHAEYNFLKAEEV